jgi:predicted RNA-binding protein associated with RNAse of E/G family
MMQAALSPIDTITFHYRRPPNREATFQSDLLSASSEMLVLAHELRPKAPVIYQGSAVLESGDLGVWFLFKGRPYDIARVYAPNGDFKGYYVDVLEPVHWQEHDAKSLMPLVDLFLDLWIDPSGNYAVLDEDEFAEAMQHGWLSSDQVVLARRTLQNLTQAIEQQQFPPEFVRTFDLCKYNQVHGQDTLL